MSNRYRWTVRSAAGRVCCESDSLNGLCLECREKAATCTCEDCTSKRQLEWSEPDYRPPDPYERGIAALRAATSTSSFEDTYKVERLRALEAEYRRAEEELRDDRPDLTDLSEYAAPDPYAAGLKALREARRS
jgi:hypothetical protein